MLPSDGRRDDERQGDESAAAGEPERASQAGSSVQRIPDGAAQRRAADQTILGWEAPKRRPREPTLLGVGLDKTSSAGPAGRTGQSPHRLPYVPAAVGEPSPAGQARRASDPTCDVSLIDMQVVTADPFAATLPHVARQPPTVTAPDPAAHAAPSRRTIDATLVGVGVQPIAPVPKFLLEGRAVSALRSSDTQAEARVANAPELEQAERTSEVSLLEMEVVPPPCAISTEPGVSLPSSGSSADTVSPDFFRRDPTLLRMLGAAALCTALALAYVAVRDEATKPGSPASEATQTTTTTAPAAQAASESSLEAAPKAITPSEPGNVLSPDKIKGATAVSPDQELRKKRIARPKKRLQKTRISKRAPGTRSRPLDDADGDKRPTMPTSRGANL